MNLTPLKVLLTAILGRLLTIVGTWIASKGLADQDTAIGIAVYAAPLAGTFLIATDIAWEYLRTKGLHDFIAYLKEKLAGAKDIVKVLIVGLLVGGTVIGTTACQTTQTVVGSLAEKSSYLQAAATAATGVYLLTISDAIDRTTAANRIWSAADGVDSLATGTLPTPDALKATIVAWGGSDADASYGEFVGTLIDSYAPVYESLLHEGDATVQETTDIVEAVAAGARAGAKQYASIAGAS